MIVQWGVVNGAQQLCNILIISKVIKSLLMIGKINILPLKGYYRDSVSQNASLPVVVGVIAAWEGRDVLKNVGVRYGVNVD
jgi:hypothetical protein